MPPLNAATLRNSVPHVKVEIPIVFFDLETTGLDVNTERVVELAHAMHIMCREVPRRTHPVCSTLHVQVDAVPECHPKASCLVGEVGVCEYHTHAVLLLLACATVELWHRSLDPLVNYCKHICYHAIFSAKGAASLLVTMWDITCPYIPLLLTTHDLRHTLASTKHHDCSCNWPCTDTSSLRSMITCKAAPDYAAAQGY
jgi:hypothetical protein